MIPILAPDELAKFRAAHAHRHPQSLTLRPPADGGEGTIEIPALLGLPSGACRMPGGSPTSSAWSQLVTAVVMSRPDPEGFTEKLTRDVIVAPAGPDLDVILNRWPALTTAIKAAALKKMGASCIARPRRTEQAPPAVATYLAEHPLAVWRVARPTAADAFAIVVEPADGGAWALFSDGLRKRDADHWKLVLDLDEACTPLIVRMDDGGATTLDATFGRWPGIGLGLMGEIAELAGAGAAAELGE